MGRLYIFINFYSEGGMKKESRWVFIINPVAGNGFAEKFASEIEEIIQFVNLAAEVIFTEKKGHAIQLTKHVINQGVDHIIAVGGDGTFNEVIQNLVNRSDITFGAIPAGTGNDFINILGFSDRFTANDWEIFFQRNTIQMDVGKCNNRYFINGMGLGFDAQVAFENYETENSQNVKGGGKNKYWWHIIKTLVTYKEKDMQLSINETTKRSKSFLNTIANGRRLAGGFYLTPDAIANDGLLTVCMIEQLKFFGRIKALLRVIKQKHTQDDVVNYFTTNQISFQFDEIVPSHLDGELLFDSKFTVSIFPASLKVIYNPHGNHYFRS